MKIKIVIIYMLAIAVLIVSGCSNKSMQQKNSGFLKSYEGLEEANKNFEGRHVRIMPGADFTKYENIYVAPVEIVSGIVEGEQTPSQKKLFQEISEYLIEGYKKEIKKSGLYTVVEDKNTPNTILFEGAISAVEVHFDDMSWYQFTPITMAVTAAARSSYVDAAVRILGEGRLVDNESGKVLVRMMSLQKGEEVKTKADELVFKDVKPALDVWLSHSKDDLAKMRKGVNNYGKQQ